MKPKWTYHVWVLLPFAAVVACFSTATVFSQWSARSIDDTARSIATNASPSIEALSAARTEVRRMAGALEQYLKDPREAERHLDDYNRARDTVDEKVRTYLALPADPGEREIWSEVAARLITLESACSHALGRAVVGDLAHARSIFEREVGPAVNPTSEAFGRSIQFSADQAQRMAMQIATARDESTRSAYWLDALCGLLACLAAVLAIRAVRRYTALLESHGELLQQRADELEQFSGRVAHDVISPLSSVTIALSMLTKQLQGDGAATRQLERGRNSVARVQRIVDGLLEFARAGARPTRDAHADVPEVVADVMSELQPDADEAGVRLRAAPIPASAVGCSPGVLTSLVANLLRNAVKYTAGVPEPQVEIRVSLRDSRVRIEVEDNGPGIPNGLEDSIFEPYVRAPGLKQAGIGLGLATVKRIVQAHRGHVGVRTAPGRGCLFWVELPRPAEPSRAEPAKQVGVPTVH